MEIAAANKGAVYVVKRKDRGERFESHVSSLPLQTSKGIGVNDDPLEKRKKSLGRIFFIENERVIISTFEKILHFSFTSFRENSTIYLDILKRARKEKKMLEN